MLALLQSSCAVSCGASLEVVTAKVGDRFVIGPQLFAQPHQFHVALRPLIQAPARPSAVQIGVNVKAVHGTSEFCRELALAHVRYLLSGLRVFPLRSRQILHLYSWRRRLGNRVQRSHIHRILGLVRQRAVEQRFPAGTTRSSARALEVVSSEGQ
jgi:hypothetical protein